MIYFARFISLIGAILLPVGLVTMFGMSVLETKVPTFVFDYWPQTFALAFLGVVLLSVGQILGSDIFKLRGKDSIIDLKHNRDGLNQYDLTGFNLD